ncbi:hypothetical protein GLE_4814 [Lysobacter enzymogenes]|uniref:Uncharacterized protein n=1 Tax=Lysobacter enzymogenes TaxID=69 RepID=A0A0S2DN62_LYSEN|nr:hypothetical protein GLE_4814 [Lysobacter enzymogenes]
MRAIACSAAPRSDRIASSMARASRRGAIRRMRAVTNPQRQRRSRKN